ncbi:hypothetical protein Leryth_003715 [Lithospermum erythrorhizon]|nr:hypothetical protein Leryth_003715 [Lithospermum erythrorhizon]
MSLGTLLNDNGVENINGVEIDELRFLKKTRDNKMNMKSVDHEDDYGSSDAISSNTLGAKRKAKGVIKRGIVALKKVIKTRRNGIKIKASLGIGYNQYHE